MRSIFALIRVSWLSFTSYRMNVVFSAVSLIVMFVPIYFVSGALQPVVEESIANEGGYYFGFLIAGMVVMQVIGAAMTGLPNAISGGIKSGTLEALFATPTPLPNLLVGLVGYALLWSTFRGTLLLAGLPLVGGDFAFSGIPAAALILVLTVLAHVPVGLAAASMILVFRTAGPLIPGTMAAISLLGGVYYSTSVIPDVVQPLAAFIPLTYGLRAFRRTLLSGEPVAAVMGDVAILAGMTVVLLAIGLAAFAWSLRYAQRAGSLAQY